MSDFYFAKNIPACHRCPKRQGNVCGGDDLAETIGAKAGEHRCPLNRFPAVGAGDLVANVLDKSGIGAIAKKVISAVTGGPCGCDKRREALNKLIPFSKG